MFYCEASSELFSKLVNVLAEYERVLLCEVDMLEDAVGWRDVTLWDEEPAMESVFVNGDDFTRFNFADELYSYGIEVQVSLATT